MSERDHLPDCRGDHVWKQPAEQAEPGNAYGWLRSTSFKPGQSGNPHGRPKRPETIEARRVVADVKAAARELTPVAMDTLEKAMTDQKTPRGRKDHCGDCSSRSRLGQTNAAGRRQRELLRSNVGRRAAHYARCS
jgi:Family of unknown function (DUF5681)